MSRSFRTLTSVLALAIGVVLLAPPSPAQASNTWDIVGAPIPGAPAGADFGWAVASSSDGTVVAVGAPQISQSGPGLVRVYQVSAGTWTQLGADIVGATNGDYTGFSVALSADGLTVAVGSPRSDPGGVSDAGVARVYRLQAGTWTQLGADIAGTGLSGQLGYAVALSASGNRAATGAPLALSRGTVSVRDYNAGTSSWVQVGSTLAAELSADEFGTSVALSDDGSWLAVGAPRNNAGGNADAGHARVFELVSTTWTQRGADIDGEVAGELAGQSIALSGNGQRLVIGAHSSDGAGPNAGRVRVFDYAASAWSLVGSGIDGSATGSEFGWAVDITSAGDQIAVGARNSDDPASDAGSVTAFTLVAGTWTQRGQTITGTAASEQAGYALAVSSTGDRIVIGSPGRALPSANTGEVRIFGFTATTSQTAEANRGQPGIYMHIAGPVGRSVKDSPIYVGSDRVMPGSPYTLSIDPDQGRAFTLTTGTTDARGNAALRVTLPTLAPGTYVITFTGRHASGVGLKLTSTITVGALGQYTTIGANGHGVW